MSYLLIDKIAHFYILLTVLLYRVPSAYSSLLAQCHRVSSDAVVRCKSQCRHIVRQTVMTGPLPAFAKKGVKTKAY